MRAIAKAVASVAIVVFLGGLLSEFASSGSRQPYVLAAGPHKFVLPPGYGFKEGRSTNDARDGVIFTAILPGLRPSKFGPTTEMVPRHRELILALLYYNGPSYSDSMVSKSNIRISGRTPSDGEPLKGYDVVKIFLDGDMYIRQSADGGPATILCFRRTRLSPPGADLSCDATISLDEREFPVRPDGRFPLTLDYSFSKSRLQDAPIIYDKLRELVGSWEAP